MNALTYARRRPAATLASNWTWYCASVSPVSVKNEPTLALS